ncbi:MAG: hypothetical protein JSS02_16275, partial [Planctomycetes bacterium]|nr:hypothetical protein [Planctomycetota bacterium]
MTTFDEETLVLYAYGRLDDSKTKEIADAIPNDPELASALEIVQRLVGFDSSDSKIRPVNRLSQVHTQLFKFGRVHPYLLAGLLIVFFSSLAGGSWIWLVPHSLLQDNFNDNWFDSRIWDFPPTSETGQGVIEADGHMKLLNRGYLISQAEFNGAIDLSFDWRWSNLGLNPVYADHLVVVLRSTGKPNVEYPFEIEDGVRLRFNAWTGKVELDLVHEPGTLQATELGVVKLPAEIWHHIRITDDGDNIAVFISGPDGPTPADGSPIFAAACRTKDLTGHIVFYNREYVGGVPHES